MVFYTRNLSSPNITALSNANYWRASFTLALDPSAILSTGSTQTSWYLSPNNARQNNMFINVKLGNTYNFGIGFYLDGNNQVQLGSGTSPTRYNTGVYIGGTNSFPAFQTYTLTYDKPNGRATLDYGAGTAVIPNEGVVSSSQMQFGSASSAGTGSAIWNNIALETLTGIWQNAAANQISTPVALGSVHVGGTFGTSALTISNTASGDFVEGLNASFGTSSGAASTNGGSITNLASGSTNSTAMAVGLGGSGNTASAGVVSGTQVILLTSNGTNSHLSDTPLASQTITLSGTVWNYAAPNSVSGSINFGTVLKGTALSQALTISNTAAASFSEKLDAAFGSATGLASGSGSVSLLAPGGSSTAMRAHLSSGSAGPASGSVAVNTTSSGVGTSGLASTALNAQTVNLAATILDPAVASFASGSTQASLLIDFGTVQQNAGVSPVAFNLFNIMQTNGYTADLALYEVISGSGNTNAITTTLPATFSDLAAGNFTAYAASLATGTLGPFSNTYTLMFKSSTDDVVFVDDTPQSLTLTVQGVVAVPEPAASLIAGIGLALGGLGLIRRHRRLRAVAAFAPERHRN